MPIVINLDAILVDSVNVTVHMPDGSQREYILNDDVPDAIGFMVFKLAQRQTELSEADDDDLAVVEARWKLTTEYTTHILGEIWRHSYPEITDAWLVSTFGPQQRMELIKL